MKKIVLATVIAALGSASALAADLPSRVYTKAEPIAPISNWAGLYIGGNVGYGWGDAGTDFFPSGTVFQATTLNNHPKGVFGGAQIGYNWQTGSSVFGFETDIQGSGIKSSARSPLVNLGGGGAVTAINGSTNSDLSWFGTVRGRLGISVMPNLLLYGTGGFAYGEVRNSANTQLTIFPFFDSFPASFNTTKTGWTAGAGAEWMFARGWSAKVEYLHIDLGTSSATARDVVASGAPIPDTTTYRWKNQYDTVRAGLNYHF